MSNVVEFIHRTNTSPLRTPFRAKRSKTSIVTPFRRPSGDVAIRQNQRDGIHLRCHHLDTDQASTPNSAAKASRVGHNSTTPRKEVRSGIGSTLRQDVLNVKPNKSQDCGFRRCLNVDVNISDHKQQFLLRTKEARERRGFTQEEIAVLLDIKQTVYHKYEVRSYMPHYLIRRFCIACGIDIDFLYEEQRNAVSQRQEEEPKKRRRKPRRHPQAA